MLCVLFSYNSSWFFWPSSTAVVPSLRVADPRMSTRLFQRGCHLWPESPRIHVNWKQDSLLQSVLGFFWHVYSAIIFVMNAVWIHLHRLLFCLFKFSQITEPKSKFIWIWSPRNIWSLKRALVPINWRITDIRGSWDTMAISLSLVSDSCEWEMHETDVHIRGICCRDRGFEM